jgi:hypothetical protein
MLKPGDPFPVMSVDVVGGESVQLPDALGANRPGSRTDARAACAVHPAADEEDGALNNENKDRCGAFTSATFSAPGSPTRSRYRHRPPTVTSHPQ